MKIFVVRSSSSISTYLALVEHLNDLCFLFYFLEFPGAAAHTVLTEFDDRTLFSRSMTSIKSSASYISHFLKSIIKVFQNILSPE